MNDIAAEVAHVIIPVYLWLFGYEMDEQSIKECHEQIEIQRHEDDENYRTTTFILVDPDKSPEGTTEQSGETSSR